MNCQEVQSLVESVIDKRLSGSDRRKFDLHIARCVSCRAQLVAEQREHTRWFRAFNGPSACHERLPSNFAERLAKAVTDERPRSRFGWTSRWTRIAACLAGVFSLAAFGSWAVVRAMSESGNGRLADEINGLEAVEASDIVPVVVVESDVKSSKQDRAAVFSVQRKQKGAEMKSSYMAVTLTAGYLLLPNIALQAVSGESCIISGSTERSCATTAWDDAGEFTLDSRVATRQFDEPFVLLDTRVVTTKYGDPLAEFCSDGPGLTIIIR